MKENASLKGTLQQRTESFSRQIAERDLQIEQLNQEVSQLKQSLDTTASEAEPSKEGKLKLNRRPFGPGYAPESPAS